MAYTAQELITQSWYLSNIVARQAQTVSGDQIADGLFLLNSFLNWKSIDLDLIPFWEYNTTITTVPGQETYFVPNCLDIEVITFNISTVRYPMDKTSRKRYFGSARVDNISSLPFSWYFNREVGGGSIYMYFFPAGTYPIKFIGKFGLQDVTLDTDFAPYYMPAYLEYLRWGLAQYMCCEYGVTFNPASQAMLDKLTRQLMYVSPPDLSLRKTSILCMGTGINYGDINIGMGYRPS